MLSWEPAQRLKLAGWPQQDSGLENIFYGGQFKKKDGVVFPDLNDLIDGVIALVPDKFLDLKSRNYTDHQWVATTSWKICGGDTPEDAMAMLWLALKERKENENGK